MIGRIRGILIEKTPPYLLLEANGIGYEIQAPMTTFYRLPTVGAELVLHTHLSITENLHQLFGFIDQRDRALFRTLIKVSSVGPKLAIAILSGMESDDIARCVQENNIAALTKVPGIGAKTAERLVVELRDRLKTWNSSSGEAVIQGKAPKTVGVSDVYAEAESALISLGYKPVDATKMIALAIKQKPDASSEELIRLALRAMASA